MWYVELTNFDLLKLILGYEASWNKTKEMYHSLLNLKMNILTPLVLRAKYEQPLVEIGLLNITSQ